MCEMCEWPLRFWWLGPHPLDGPVHRGSPDAEEFGDLSLTVGAEVVQLEQVLGLVRLELRLLAAQPTLGFRYFHPSRVPSRIRSASNSATIANTLNSSRPTGSAGSWIDPPRLSLTFLFVSSSRMSRASGSDRASRSSLVTTNVSPARQAARANRSPGRSRLAPVKPWST